MNKSLNADERADLVLKQLTLPEKVNLLHGTAGLPGAPAVPGTVVSNGGAGATGGVARLGIPAIQMADAAYGVTHGKQTGRYATALPSNLAAAATWDPALAYAYGVLIGKELRAHGYNMSLGGGVNLTREPRNGRTFEYVGEDPLLAGTMVGMAIKGVQSQHVIGEIKHFALNDQESGRNAVNVLIDERVMRESDMRAFQIGLRVGEPGAVMCSYNRLAGDYACENQHLLGDILKGDLQFKGFVLSDWGGTHSTLKALRAGMDNEEPSNRFYGDALLKMAEAGEVSQKEIDEHAHRILRTMFANGLMDYPTARDVVDVDAGLVVAQSSAEQSIVLLKNRDNVLPLTAKVKSIAIIGGHADVAMISGGGSAQVDPPGGNAITPVGAGGPETGLVVRQTWFPQSPMKALQERFPGVRITFDSGDDVPKAVALAKASDVAIVFGWQWETESFDLDTLALSDAQNTLIAAVTAANARTIVVVETGGPVTMPWASSAAGIVEAWYAGSRGATALARILAGDVNPSAKLPVTFPLSDADLPHPTLVKPPAESRPLPPPAAGAPIDISTAMARQTRVLAPFPLNYDEGLKVGYKWYDAEKKPVLFPFGFGLSYTQFAYSNLKLDHTADGIVAHFTLTNKGKREGAEVAQVYAGLPAATNEPPRRLAGWQKVKLAPGESKAITIALDSESLAIYDTAAHGFTVPAGTYTVSAGGSSQDLPLKATVALDGTH